jgi:serine/threonine protein kinase
METLFQRYQILEEVAKGGFGKVYKAYDIRLGRIVAIKELRSQITSPERALSEARAVAVLNHPNIVTLHDIEITKEACYLIMEYLEGITLRHLLREKPLPLEVAIAFIQQVCYALEYAHLNEVVHGDVKPENLLLQANGQVKATDFGIAFFKSSQSKPALVGTPSYLAPEVAKGQVPSEKSDLYATALSFYEMIVGKNPFRAQTAKATLFKVQNVEPLAPSKANPNLPPQLDQVLLAALSKNPELRPKNMVEFRYALERFRTTSLEPEKLLQPLAKKVSSFPQAVETSVEERNLLNSFWFKLLGSGFIGGLLFLTLHATNFYPQLWNAIFSSLVVAAFLISPFAGWLIALAIALPTVISFSLPLGLFFLALTIVILPILRTRPLHALIALLAPVFFLIKLDYLYLFLIAWCFSPLESVFLTAGGGLIAIITALLGNWPIEVWQVPASFQILSQIKDEQSFLKVGRLLIKPVLSHPVLLINLAFLSLIAFLTSWLLKQFKYPLNLAFLTGLTGIIFLGSTQLPSLLNLRPPLLSQLSLRLTLSFITFSVILILKESFLRKK